MPEESRWVTEKPARASRRPPGGAAILSAVLERIALLSALLGALQQPAPRAPELPARALIDCLAPLRDMALDADGERVFTLTEEGTLAAWTRATPRELWRISQPGAFGIECGERELVLEMHLPYAGTIDPLSGAHREKLEGPGQGEVTGFAADPRARFAWASTAAGLARMSPVEKWSWHPLDTAGLTALALDAKGAELALGCKDGSVRFASAEDGALDAKKLVRGASAITALAWTAKDLLVASEDGALRLWHPGASQAKTELLAGGTAVRALAVAGRGDLFASGDAEGQVCVGRCAEGVRMRWKGEPASAVVALAFTPDAKALLVAVGTRVVELDLAGSK